MWLTTRIVRPSFATLAIFAMHFFRNAVSPTDNTSSTIRISGSRCAATENASRTYIPLEYRFTGVSRNVSTPEKSTISSNFASISPRFIPRIAPFMKMFSRPVSSGWNPVPTSSSDPVRPSITARPSDGSVIRVRIFSNVDFPAPLCPTMPTVSPGCTSNDTFRSAQKSRPMSPCATFSRVTFPR